MVPPSSNRPNLIPAEAAPLPGTQFAPLLPLPQPSSSLSLLPSLLPSVPALPSGAARPAPNFRERLETGFRRFENFRSGRPEEARRWIREEMPALIDGLEENLRAQAGDLLQDLRLIRQVRRSAFEFQGGAELERDLHNVEGAMRLLRTHLRSTFYVPPGGRPNADQIRSARVCAEISRDLGEYFYFHDDLLNWSRLLSSSSEGVMGQAEASFQALALLQGWSVLRDVAIGRIENSNPSPLPMSETQITAQMQDARRLLVSRMDLPGRASEAVEQQLVYFIDEIASRSLGQLTVENLSAYAVGASDLQTQIDRAQSESDLSARRPLLFQALRSAVELGSENQARRIRDLLESALPAAELPGTESLRLETLVSVFEIIRGHELGIEAPLQSDIERLGNAIANRERALLTPEELSGRSLPPSHPASGTPAELVQRARALSLMRSFYLSTGNQERAGFLFLSLRRVRTELRASLRAGHEGMDAPTYAGACRSLAELSMVMADTRDVEWRIRGDEIYATMLSQAQSRGQDVSWSHQQRAIREQADQAARHEYGEGLRSDNDRWLVAIGRLRQATPPVAMESRLEHCRAASLLLRNLRSLREGGETLVAQNTLDSRSQVLEQYWTGFFEDSLEQRAGASTAQQALAGDIVYDLRTRIHFAMADNAPPQQVAWLANFNSESLLEFAQSSQAAHLLTMDRLQDPPSAAELQNRLQAAQVYASLGLNNRVLEVTQPLEAYAYGLNIADSAQAGQRANLLLVLAQVYSQAGSMDLKLRNTLQEIVALDRPGELHGSAQLARAMVAMQDGNLQEVKNLLLSIPDHPMAQTFLQNLQRGEQAQRIVQTVRVLRAVSLNFIERGRQHGEDLRMMEQDTLNGWQEVQRLLLSGDCHDVSQAIDRMLASGRFSHFNSGTREYHVASHVGAFLGAVDDPNLSESQFHDAIFRLSSGLRSDGYFLAANIIYQAMEGDPQLRVRAQEAASSIPGEARFQAIVSPFAIFTSGSDPSESLANLAMVMVPFGVARGAAVGAEGLFVARATGGTIRMAETGLVVQAGSRSVQGLRAMSFGVRASTEAAAFTVSSMGLHSLFTGRTDNWTWGNFGREFGTMLLTFGLCHGIGLGVQGLGRSAARADVLRSSGLRAELGAAALRPGARGTLSALGYGSTIAGLTGLEYFNEAIGLRPNQGEVPLYIRLLGSAAMDAQMRAAGRGIDAVSGGRISSFENSTRDAQNYHELLPVLDRLGIARPDADGRMAASTAFVMNMLQTRVAQGEDPGAIVASFNPSPRTVRAAQSSAAWPQWLRSHALGMAFIFTGTLDGGIMGMNFPARREVDESAWWADQSQRDAVEDRFAEQDFADVYWPNSESGSLRLGLPDAPVNENQLALLVSCLAETPAGNQPPVRIELASLADPTTLSALLPMLRRGFTFEIQLPNREPIRFERNSHNVLLVDGLDAGVFRALAPRLRDFSRVEVQNISAEAEALEIVRIAAEAEGPEVSVSNGAGQEWIRYAARGFNVNAQVLTQEYLERVCEMAGRRPVRAMVDGLPLMVVSRSPNGLSINLELQQANPAQTLSILRRVSEIPEASHANTEVHIQNMDPNIYGRPEIRQALAAIARTALAGGTRRMDLRLTGSGRNAGPLAFRFTENPAGSRTRYRMESDFTVDRMPELLSEYLAAESAEIYRLGNPEQAPTREALSQLWNAAMLHAQVFSRHHRAGEPFRRYWNEEGSLERWLNGITVLGSYARAPRNAERVQQALANILNFSELEGTTVLTSNGFNGRALGDNGFELLRLAEQDQGYLSRALDIVRVLMGRNNNVEVGGALVGIVFKTLIADEGGALQEVNVLREQVQAALAQSNQRFRFVILPEDREIRVTTPEWVMESLDPSGRPTAMLAVEVKSRNVRNRDFNENALRETLNKAIQQLTTHGFNNGSAAPQAVLAMRFSNVGRNSSLGADVARLVSSEYQRLNGSSLLRERAAAERMRLLEVEVNLLGPDRVTIQRIRLRFEAGRWSQPVERQAG